MRKQLVTVRFPGASIAPINSTWACRQTRSENKGAQVLNKGANNGGRANKQDHFPGLSPHYRPLMKWPKSS
jgi:hypothetical protein